MPNRPHNRAVSLIWMIVFCMAFYSVAPALAQTGARRQKPKPSAAASPTETSQPIASPTVAQYLPANELMLVELRNLDSVFSVLDNLFKSEAMQEILKSDPKNPVAMLAKYDTMLAAMGFPDKATLGKMRVGAALRLSFPAKAPARGSAKSSAKAQASSKEPEPEPEFVLVVEGPTPEAVTSLATAVSRIADSGNVPKKGVVTVGKTKITTYPADNSGTVIGTAQTGKLYLVGQVTAVKALLGTLTAGPGTSLAATPDFQLVQEKIGRETEFTTYINSKAIGVLLEQGVRAYTAARTAPAKSAGKGKSPKAATEDDEVGKVVLSRIGNYLGLPSLGGIGFGVKMAPKDLAGWKQNFFMAVDRKGKGLFPILADAPNVTMRGAAVVPASAQVFSAFGVNHLRLYDETLQAMRELPIKDGPPADAIVAGAELGLGFKIRDEFLVGLSGEYGVAFDFGDLSKFADKGPDPKTARGVFYAGLKNPGLVQTAVEKARAMMSADQKKEKAEKGPEKETYQNIGITRFEEIGVAVLDDFLVAGRLEDIKWVIDARVAGKTIDKNESFRQAMANAPTNSIGSYYVSETLPRAFLEQTKQAAPPELLDAFKSASITPVVGHLTHDDQGIYSDTFSPLLGAGIGSAIAIPNLLAARRSANTVSAMQTLRNLNTAQVTYSLGKGKGNYTSRLEDLGEKGTGFLDNATINMQQVPKSGYLLGPIMMTPATKDRASTYSITAFPAVKEGPNRTGNDCFFVDDTGVIRHSGSATVPATEKSEPIQ